MGIKGILPPGLALTILTGCTSMAVRVPAIQISDRTVLVGFEYGLLADVSGKACRRHYGLWPIPIFWETGKGEDGAAVDALSHAEGADILLKTTVQDETYSVGIWYSETCTTVSGKAVKIKLAKMSTGSEPQAASSKPQSPPIRENSGESSDKKVYMKDGSIIAGKSIVIDGANLQVGSARGLLTLPVKDALRIE